MREHIRLMVGASGGMQAAALYAADFKENPKAWRLSDRLAEDSLWPTVQTMLLNDGPALVWPGSLTQDRGRSLEQRWERNCSPWTKDGQSSAPPPDWFRHRRNYSRGNSPLARPLYELRTEEPQLRPHAHLFADEGSFIILCGHRQITDDQPTAILSIGEKMSGGRFAVALLGAQFRDGRAENCPAAWFRHRRYYSRGTSPLARPLYELRTEERNCESPTLIFSPMLVEDCRRLIISNLSMEWFTHTDMTNLNDPAVPYQPKKYPDRFVGAGSGVPGGTFPTPARTSRSAPLHECPRRSRSSVRRVSLPSTRSTRARVVDAGYFDNFRTQSRWYLVGAAPRVDPQVHVRRRHRRNPGVSAPRGETPLPPPRGIRAAGNRSNWALGRVRKPIPGVLYNLYARGAYFRNDQLLDFLDEEFNGPRKARKLEPKDRFFTSVAFECDLDGAQPAKGTRGTLSWTLSKQEVESIRNQFTVNGNLQPGVAKQVKLLGQWFDTGGTY